MKKSLFLYLLSGSLLTVGLGGCSLDIKKTEEPTEPQSLRIEPRIAGRTEIVRQSSAGEEVEKKIFQTGDIITVAVSQEGQLATSFEYTVGAGELSWEDLQLPDGTRAVEFAGCYPVCGEDSRSFVFDLMKTDKPDLLLASVQKVVVGSEEPVSMTFNHAMHCLVLRYEASSDDSVDPEQITTRCDAITSCEVDLTKGQIAAVLDDRRGEREQVGSVAAFLLVPQAPGEVELTTSVGEKVIETRLSDLIAQNGLSLDLLESGKSLTLTVAVEDEQLVVVDAEIGGWKDQGSVDSEMFLGK